MALARLQVNVGKTGKAAPHASYICRMGKYENRLKNSERLLKTESGNMPKWAQENPLKFWEAADEFERSNGTTYREMEIALPRELDEQKQVELVRRWVKQELGEKHAFQWAIHVPKAADGGDQPHVHLMFSERQIDGIERDPNQYFKRYNSRSPEKGGAKKGYGDHAGQTLSKAERIEDLKKLRMRWQKTCNDYLHWHSDSQARIDMRSYAERGLDIIAEPKQLPSQWRGEGKNAVLALRAAKAEVQEAYPQLEAASRVLVRFRDDVERAEQAYREESDRYAVRDKREALEKAKLAYELGIEEVAAGRVPKGVVFAKEIERRFQDVKAQLDQEEQATQRVAEQVALEQAQREREAAEAAQQQKTLEAKQCVEAWNSDINQKVAARQQRLGLLQARLAREIARLNSERKQRLEAHQREEPKRPSFLTELFKPQAYSQALSVWEDKHQQLEARGQHRQYNLDKRLRTINRHLDTVKGLYDVLRDGLHVIGSELVSKAIKQLIREQPELQDQVGQAAAHLQAVQRKEAQAQAQEKKRQREAQRQLEQSRSQGRGWSR